ncbi:MAG: type II toxin-antitoxin system RelE/ParE family toxin [Tannerella sp.]|jgi:hypothetical protein|nr:type II toxin-antitoxin system RelE/ParE family toxin [Tannerella sp.]
METNYLVTRRFDRSYKKLKKKYASLQSDLKQFKKDFAENHEMGTDLGGGFRKIRIAIQSKGKGKSGGARIITYELCLKAEDGVIVLVDIYDKSEKETLNDSEYIKILNEFIAEL